MMGGPPVSARGFRISPEIPRLRLRDETSFGRLRDGRSFTRRASVILALLIVVVLPIPLFAQPASTSSQRDVVQVVGAPAGSELSGDALEKRTKEVSSLLRCPVCQGLAISDSPSTMARDMKMQVRELLAAGYSEDQILRYFENSYGQFVRLEPPLSGVSMLVWLAPLLVLIAGAVIIFSVIRRHQRQAAPDSRVIDRDMLPSDGALVPYVLRVRELAYGWPGGVAPKTAVNSVKDPA